jgi:hypothetical protein
MKWNSLEGLRYAWLVILKKAMQERGMIMCMQGSYQREWTQEFTKMKDIITVSELDVISDLCCVSRTIVKEYVFESVPATQTHEKEEWFAVYNSATKQLVDLKGGRRCTFYPTESILLFGDNTYQKIGRKTSV